MSKFLLHLFAAFGELTRASSGNGSRPAYVPQSRGNALEKFDRHGNTGE
jgi:hypothetical protein